VQHIGNLLVLWRENPKGQRDSRVGAGATATGEAAEA
jgi:hypothetical protein